MATKESEGENLMPTAASDSASEVLGSSSGEFSSTRRGTRRSWMADTSGKVLAQRERFSSDMRLASEAQPQGNEVPGGSGEKSICPSAKSFASEIVRPSKSERFIVFQRVVIALIFVSTSSVVIETVPEFRDSLVFVYIEAMVTTAFTLELLLRLVGSQEGDKNFFSGFNSIDLLAVFPGWLELARVWWMKDWSALSVRAGNVLLVVRIMRLVKILRYARLLKTFLAVFQKVWYRSILVLLTLIVSLATVSASALYFVESDRCESIGVHCEGFDSIPSAGWFAITTLTTVGYGDRVPFTFTGKVIAASSSVAGIMVIALAGAMLSWDFAEFFNEETARVRLSAEQKRRASARANSKCLSSSSAEDNGILEEIQMQQAAQQFVEAINQLTDHLITMCSAREPVGEEPREAKKISCERPLLKMIQEKAVLLRDEVQSFTFTMVPDERPPKRSVEHTAPDSARALSTQAVPEADGTLGHALLQNDSQATRE